MTRRHKTVAFTPEQLAAKVKAILAFTDPPPPPARPARQRRPSPHAPDVLVDRAFVICQRWAKLSGHPVKIADARRVANLRLPLPAVLAILQSVHDRPRGLGACWPDLRRAEAQLTALALPHGDDQVAAERSA